MRRRIYAVLVLIAVSALGTACAFESGRTAEPQETEMESYRVELTAEEMEAGYAEFQMDERIYVDASVTQNSVYANGVDSYYVLSLCEPDEETETEESGTEEASTGKAEPEEAEMGISMGEDATGETLEEITEEKFLGYSSDEFYSLLAEYSSVDFSESIWYFIPEICWFRLSSFAAYDPTYIYPNGFLPNYKLDTGGALSWATEEETGQEVLEFLERLTGADISEDWECAAYSQENLAEALDALETEMGDGAYYMVYDYDTNELLMEEKLDASDFREFYSFWFPYDVNGISTSLCPMSHGSNTIYLAEGETPGEYLYELSNGTYMVDESYLTVDPIQIGVCEDGIFYMYISCGWSLGDVYKEAEEVLSASDILIRCEGYLQSEIIVDTLTVTDVSLIYDLGYTDTDKEDGVVEPVLRPYWLVSTYNNWARTHKAFIFDARTGNLVDSTEYYLD